MKNLKKLLCMLTLCTSCIFISNTLADEFAISAHVGNGDALTIYRHNVTQGTTEILRNDRTISSISSESFVDTTKGYLYLQKGSNKGMLIYDYVNDQYIEETSDYNYLGTRYIIPYSNKSGEDIITTGTDAEDGSSTTILGSLDISDSNGNTLIENKPDGSVHIGENSLVTQEVNGVQQLYATNSAGNQIDLNIKSGTNLLIGGRNIMDIIGGDISGSVALSSALAALPNSSPDAFYTCGLGTGIHDSSSALSAGCASDFSNYAFADNLPKIFQTASFNIGSSFLMNGEPDISEARDMSIKAGITFKFGSVKPTRVADRNNHMLENKIDAVMQENRTLKAQLKEENDTIRQENDLLKAQIAEINTQLKALNILAMN